MISIVPPFIKSGERIYPSPFRLDHCGSIGNPLAHDAKQVLTLRGIDGLVLGLGKFPRRRVILVLQERRFDLAAAGIHAGSERGNLRPVAFGAITTPAHTDIEARLLIIKNDLETIIDKYHPEEMAIEELFFNTNITTGIAVAEARGVILCTAHRLGLKISEYTPLQVKQAVVGYGKAEKQQVIAMVTSLLKLPKPPKPDDAADAVAIAICHSNSNGSAMSKYFNQR